MTAQCHLFFCNHRTTRSSPKFAACFQAPWDSENQSNCPPCAVLSRPKVGLSHNFATSRRSSGSSAAKQENGVCKRFSIGCSTALVPAACAPMTCSQEQGRAAMSPSFRRQDEPQRAELYTLHRLFCLCRVTATTNPLER